MQKIFSAALEAFDKGEDAVLCGVIAASGSTPRGAGAKLLITQNESLGTIGGGAIELEAAKIAGQMLAERTSALRSFDLSSSNKADLGMVCGGRATVCFQFLDRNNAGIREMLNYALSLWERDVDAWLVTPVGEGLSGAMGIWAEGELRFASGISAETVLPHLSSKAVYLQGETPLYIEPLIQGGTVCIFGGGHVGQALAPVAAGVGFRVVVFDDRERFADISLFPGASRAILGDFNHLDDSVALTDKDYAVIVTRGHEADYTVLEQVLRTPASYVGMIGSRSKMAHTMEKLREAGFGQNDFDRIYNPIGISIMAETPQEIAISITAELILHRARRRQGV